MAIKKAIDKYAHFISVHPVLVLSIVIILFITAFAYMQRVDVKSLDIKDILPAELDVIKSMDILQDTFGGTASGLIILEIDPSYKNSEEPRDIRVYKILKYQEIIQKSIKSLEDVVESASSTDILKILNNNIIPKSNTEIKKLTKDNPSFDSYISNDKTISLIRVTLIDDFDEENIAKELQLIVNQLPKQEGVKVSIGGSSLESGVVNEIITPDMNKTSMYSMIGILVVLLIISGSIIYGLIPLTTIIIGVVWAMGFVGLLGMNLNSATSAVISMIMGIGIDFGIQITTRFREEKEKRDIENSMRVTMESVLYPMIITTLAALIGFWAMSLGTIKILGEMGQIMSYGVLMCFFAAITAVPSIIILTEKLTQKIKENRRRNKNEI